MIHYVDASVLVAALTSERRTLDMQRWLATAVPGDIAISDWTHTEVAAALSIKVRIGTISEREQAISLDKFGDWMTDQFTVLPVRRANFRLAAQFARRATTGLRAGDALHLAISHDAGLSMATLDVGLAKASAELGIAAQLL